MDKDLNSAAESITQGLREAIAFANRQDRSGSQDGFGVHEIDVERPEANNPEQGGRTGPSAEPLSR